MTAPRFTIAATFAALIALSFTTGARADVCIAIGEPCNPTDVCCGGANCGAYGAFGETICGFAPGTCRPAGASCATSDECGCAESCLDGACVAPTDSDGGACVAIGAPCNGGDTCCNGSNCGPYGSDGGTLCGFATGACLPAGEMCSTDAECCSGGCTNHVCEAPRDASVCIGFGEQCLPGDVCCDGFVCTSRGDAGFQCAPPSVTDAGTCVPNGMYCVFGAQCCSGACGAGRCGPADDGGACLVTNAPCTAGSRCCGGMMCRADLHGNPVCSPPGVNCRTNGYPNCGGSTGCPCSDHVSPIVSPTGCACEVDIGRHASDRRAFVVFALLVAGLAIGARKRSN